MKPTSVIVETPRGSTGKFAFDELKQQFILKKILPLGMAFPFDFGFLPGTSGEDDAPLDVIIICESATFPGCAIDCRIIGVITAKQQERSSRPIRNDRYIAVAEASLIYSDIKEMKQLPKKLLAELEAFFTQYNKLEEKKFTVLNRLNATKASELVKKNRKKMSAENK